MTPDEKSAKRRAHDQKNRDEINAKRRVYLQENRDKVNTRRRAYGQKPRAAEARWRRLGVLDREGQPFTWSDYTELLAAQAGACLLCSRVPQEGEKRLVPDHCHKTGICRALIRDVCNRAIGFLESAGVNVVTWAHRASVLLMVPKMYAGGAARTPTPAPRSSPSSTASSSKSAAVAAPSNATVPARPKSVGAAAPLPRRVPDTPAQPFAGSPHPREGGHMIRFFGDPNEQPAAQAGFSKPGTPRRYSLTREVPTNPWM